ncbi:MAG TPA: M13 family metallopeptidase [Gemmatimonadales bacterium]|nr:M13 family metallopeptidase [Gemmatimonadales bacterium]
MIRSGTRNAALLVSLLATCLSLAPLDAQESPPPLGLDSAGMDRSVRPGDDFFRYANGTWARETEIPADRSSYGAFYVADQRAGARLAELVQGAAAANGLAGSDLRKIGDYYTAYVDTAAIERAGLEPIRPVLAAIAAIDDRTALARYLGATLRADVDVINNGALHTDNLFGLWVGRDFDTPSRYSAILLQGGPEMPDRRYYLDTSATMVAIRGQYRAHISWMLALAGFADTAARADAVLDLETRIAEAHWNREDTWDVLKGDNHWARADFDAKAPGLDWEAFFRAAQLDDQHSFVAWQPSAITGLSALVASQPLESWKTLLAYHALEHHAAVLPAAFDREAFAFFGKTLSGVPEQAPRTRRAVDATSRALGFAVGRMYVDRYFPASAKKRAEAMVAEIIKAFERRIDRLVWMAPATKVAAKAKLKTLRVSVGYPDQWPDYARLEVAPGDAFGNLERLERFEYGERVARLGLPVDRSEWVMTPQLVNAVNMPAMNAMNFPAGILQPPFFDPDRPDVMNYGAIGAVIGHEISHSFDNLGANFDADGRLRNWWTPEDLAHFTAATALLARQYDQYRPFPDLAVNGKLTLSENIADLAGLTAAYDAYRASLGGKEAPPVAGWSGDQQFFLSFEQVWRVKYRDPALRQLVLTNGHAPGQYRALTVRNIDAWYQAFEVTPDETEYLGPNDRVRIW